jgi:hypothetical protein
MHQRQVIAGLTVVEGFHQDWQIVVELTYEIEGMFANTSNNLVG